MADRYRRLATLADEPQLRRLQWAGWVVGLRLAEEAGERTAGPASVAPWPAPPARTT